MSFDALTTVVNAIALKPHEGQFKPQFASFYSGRGRIHSVKIIPEP